MTTITEGKLTFSFPNTWKVNKYDESNFFKNHVYKCQGSKGVDILALSDNRLFIIEVKDFRGYRIENKQRLKSGELVIEVTQKVRDTLAGLYAACRWQTEELAYFYNHLYAKSKCSMLTRYQPKITLILFIEQDSSPHPLKRFEISCSDLESAMKNQLKFLNINCLVHNKETYAKKPLGWFVVG